MLTRPDPWDVEMDWKFFQIFIESLNFVPVSNFCILVCHCLHAFFF